MIITLIVVILAFNWKTYENKIVFDYDRMAEDIIEEIFEVVESMPSFSSWASWWLQRNPGYGANRRLVPQFMYSRCATSYE